MDELLKEQAQQAHKARAAFRQSLHEARLLDARAAANVALLINGAAATAMLTFLGSLAQSSAARHLPFDFVRSLAAFGTGVFSAACMAAASYVANHSYANAEATKADTWAWPFVQDGVESPGHTRSAVRAHGIAYAAAFCALGAFVAGVGYAADGFTHLR